MAMVVSRKSKCCICSLFLLVAMGITLAVISTLGLLEKKKEHHYALAEKYSQTKSAPQVVEIGGTVSNVDL